MLKCLHSLIISFIPLQVDVALAAKELKAILPDICNYFVAKESGFQSYATLYLLSCPKDSSVGLTFHQLKDNGQITLSQFLPCEENLYEDLFLNVC